MRLPERSVAMFKGVEKNYWEYYRELEDDFIATRKYVSFHEANASTFSLEYLKLFQAVCSEVDVVGKAMAAACNPEFKSEKGNNNIYKWWFEIQESYLGAAQVENGCGCMRNRQCGCTRYRCG